MSIAPKEVTQKIEEIYLVIRECGEIECAFRSKEEAEEYREELEQMANGNTSWEVRTTYCY